MKEPDDRYAGKDDQAGEEYSSDSAKYDGKPDPANKTICERSSDATIEEQDRYLDQRSGYHVVDLDGHSKLHTVSSP